MFFLELSVLCLGEEGRPSLPPLSGRDDGVHFVSRERSGCSQHKHNPLCSVGMLSISAAFRSCWILELFLWQWPGIQAQLSGSYLMNNYVMNSAITRIDLADNLLPWRKYFTYFYPCFLPVSQLIIPYRTFSKTLLGRKLGERCLNILVHLNENRGFNFSIFWKKKKKTFSFVKLFGCF